MAGSRIEKLGTVFTRVQGLLKTGAMKESDKPVWYEVYAAFPPRIDPKYDRFVEQRDPINILYPEDKIRAKFYNTFVSPDVIDMHKKDSKSTCQRFVEKYMELDKSSTSSVDGDELFDKTTESLRSDGLHLKTLAQQQLEREALQKARGVLTSITQHTPVSRSNVLISTDSEVLEALDEDIVDEGTATKNPKLEH